MFQIITAVMWLVTVVMQIITAVMWLVEILATLKTKLFLINKWLDQFLKKQVNITSLGAVLTLYGS